MARQRRRVGTGDAVPRHHDRVARQTRALNLVPTDEPPTMGAKVPSDPLREIVLQRVGVVNSERAGARLNRQRRHSIRL